MRSRSTVPFPSPLLPPTEEIIHVCIHMYVFVIHVNVCMHIHTYIYIYIYIYTHVLSKCYNNILIDDLPGHQPSLALGGCGRKQACCREGAASKNICSNIYLILSLSLSIYIYICIYIYILCIIAMTAIIAIIAIIAIMRR